MTFDTTTNAKGSSPNQKVVMYSGDKINLNDYTSMDCSTVSEPAGSADDYTLPQICYLSGINSGAASSKTINYAKIEITPATGAGNATATATVTTKTLNSPEKLSYTPVTKDPIMRVNADTGEMMFIASTPADLTRSTPAIGTVYTANLASPTPLAIKLNVQPSGGIPYAVYQD